MVDIRSPLKFNGFDLSFLIQSYMLPSRHHFGCVSQIFICCILLSFTSKYFQISLMISSLTSGFLISVLSNFQVFESCLHTDVRLVYPEVCLKEKRGPTHSYTQHRILKVFFVQNIILSTGKYQINKIDR